MPYIMFIMGVFTCAVAVALDLSVRLGCAFLVASPFPIFFIAIFMIYVKRLQGRRRDLRRKHPEHGALGKSWLTPWLDRIPPKMRGMAEGVDVDASPGHPSALY